MDRTDEWIETDMDMDIYIDINRYIYGYGYRYKYRLAYLIRYKRTMSRTKRFLQPGESALALGKVQNL